LQSSFKKNLSIKEHRDILKKRYTNKKLSTNGLIINTFEDYYYIESNLASKFNNQFISGDIIKDMFNVGFLTYNIGEIIFLKDGFLLNSLTEKTYKFNCVDSGLFFDTSIFYFNYLNFKTINHFSKLIVKKEETIFLMKRSKWFVIFGLKL